MAGAPEAVRRLSYKVDSDDAVQRIQSVGAAQKGVTAALREGSAASAENEVRTVALNRRYEDIAKQQQAMRAAMIAQAVAAGSAMATATAANDNYARSSSHVADVLRIATKTAVDHAASWAATAGAVGAGVLVVGSLLAVLGPLYLAYKLVKEGIDLVTEAWDLGGKKLEEYRQIATKAAAVDLSTTYFQQLTKGAEAAKAPVDTLTQALVTLQKQSADQLGGSALQNRLDASVKAGNFSNNPGVAQFAAANSTEERYKAIVALIHQAMEDGQRLAALDIAKTAFGPDITDALRKNSAYLDQIGESAAKVAATELVSPADVGRALDLQRRYDAAVSILEQRWHPVQDLLTAAGIRMREVWVDIVDNVAKAVDWATKLVLKIGELPVKFWDSIQSGANAVGKFFLNNTTTPDSRAAAEKSYGISSSPADLAATAAVNDQAKAIDGLSASMKNYYLQQQMVTQASAVTNKVRGDNSRTIDTETKSLVDIRDAYDRARDAAQKHYAQTVADSDAIGLGIGAQAEFRTKAALTTAALIAQRDMTPTLRKEIDAYGAAARTAAEANERLKVAAQIKFDRATIGLSPEDVQIASQLKGMYPDVTTALNSTEAAQMRLNNQMRLGNEIVTSFGNDLFSGLLRGQDGMKALEGAASNLIAKLGSKNLQNFLTPGGSIFGNQNLNSAQGAVGIAGAGLAGYQSGNPLTGALGGAMAGATFGPAGAVIGGLAGLIGGFLGKDSQAAQALQEAQQQWARMTDQVTNFDLAAKGVDLGPLTSQLQSLHSTSKDLQDAAAKAHDFAGEQSAASAFNNAVERIWTEFKTGTQTLDPLQQQMKAVKDEAAGLKDTLNELGFSGRAAQIDSIVQQQIDALTKQFNATFISGLTARLNTATGQTFLNDAANLLVQHQQDLTQAGELGSDPTLLAQVAATFHAEAQKIVDDAGLVGDAFTDFTKQFPDLAGIVVQANQDMSASAKQLQDQMNQSAKTIVDFVNGLFAGSNSTLSPTQQLASAQLSYNTKLGLAQGGNADALGSITSDAQNLLTAARAVYASSASYQSIFQNVTSSLLNLPAVQQTTDPAVQAMRDVLTAINLGNIALGLINSTAGGTTTAVNDVKGVQSGLLLPAITAGNAANVAAALAPYLNAIDPTGQLASVVATSANSSSFAQAYFPALNANTANTNANVNTNNALVTAGNSLVTSSNQFLTSVNTFADRIIQALNAQGAMQAGNYSKMILNSAVLLNWMPQLVYGGPGSKATGSGGGVSDAVPYTAHATGGVIPAYGVGLVSEHSPGGGRFIQAGADPITVSPFPAQIPFRGGNDNGGGNAALLAEMRELRKEVQRLQTIVSGSDAMTRRTIEENGDKVAGKVDDQTDRLGAQQRQSDRQHRVANR